MKTRIFSLILMLGSSTVCLAEGRRTVPTSCGLICSEGQLNRETCTCETNSNPRPSRRIWPAVDNETEDDVVWDEDDE